MGDTQIVTQFLGSLVIIEILKWLVARFMKKTVGTQYMTVADCEACRTNCGDKRDGAHAELVRLIKTTRFLIVRYLIRAGAAPEEIEEALGDS